MHHDQICHKIQDFQLPLFKVRKLIIMQHFFTNSDFLNNRLKTGYNSLTPTHLFILVYRADSICISSLHLDYATYRISTTQRYSICKLWFPINTLSVYTRLEFSLKQKHHCTKQEIYSSRRCKNMNNLAYKMWPIHVDHHLIFCEYFNSHIMFTLTLHIAHIYIYTYNIL